MRKAILVFLCLTLLLGGCGVNVEPDSDPMDIAAAAPVVLATPRPTPQPVMQLVNEPEPLEEVEEPVGEPYKCRVNEAYVRSSPDKSSDGNIIASLGYEEEVLLLQLQEGEEFSEIQLNDGRHGYCFTEFLVPADAMLYAYLKAETGQKIDIPTGKPVYNDDGSPVMVKNELVDLRLYLPDAPYELLFATEKNVIGEPLYPRAIPLIQKDTAKKLQKAFDQFKKDGYILKIYDAYRPISVQRRLFNVVKNSNWIANPNTTASNHNRGAAVDISLIDSKTGKELEFPTPMHTFTKDSARGSKSWSSQARKNVDYMTKVMLECGFNSIKSEWWHFSDSNSKKFMTTDIDLGRLTMLPKQEEEI